MPAYVNDDTIHQHFPISDALTTSRRVQVVQEKTTLRIRWLSRDPNEGRTPAMQLSNVKKHCRWWKQQVQRPWGRAMFDFSGAARRLAKLKQRNKGNRANECG